MEKQEFTITLYTENSVGLIGRISGIFSRRKINTDFLKAAVMLIRISNINMEIDIFGAEEIM